MTELQAALLNTETSLHLLNIYWHQRTLSEAISKHAALALHDAFYQLCMAFTFLLHSFLLCQGRGAGVMARAGLFGFGFPPPIRLSGSGSLLLSCVSQGLSINHEDWQQVLYLLSHLASPCTTF